MVRPALRSRSFRKMRKRLPGGKYAMHYEKRKPAAPRCAGCKGVLHGMPRIRPIRLGNIASSRRTVSRPYGGSLCSGCMRARIRDSIIR